MAYTAQYIGSRYVPIFAEPAEWNSARTYEPLTIVLHNGNSYTSRQFVPTGIQLENENYWLKTGNYNAQLEQYRQQVIQNQYATNMFASLDDAAGYASYLNLGQLVYINNKPYLITDATPNGMDSLRIANGKTATLIFNDMLSPQDIGYANQADAAPFINRCITLCQSSATVKLYGTYTTLTPVTLYYDSNIYVNNLTFIVANAATIKNPAIKFAGYISTHSERTLAKPMNGNVLTILNTADTYNTRKTYVCSTGVDIENASVCTIANLHVAGFGQNFYIHNSHNYCLTLDNVCASYGYTGITYNADTDSGERISIQNSIFGSNSIPFYHTAGKIASLQFFNTSFDFNESVFYNDTSLQEHIDFIGCHFEGNYNVPTGQQKVASYGYLYYGASFKYTRTFLKFTGCEFNYSQRPTDLPETLINDSNSYTTISNCTCSGEPGALYFSSGFCDKGVIFEDSFFIYGSNYAIINPNTRENTFIGSQSSNSNVFIPVPAKTNLIRYNINVNNSTLYCSVFAYSDTNKTELYLNDIANTNTYRTTQLSSAPVAFYIYFWGEERTITFDKLYFF